MIANDRSDVVFFNAKVEGQSLTGEMVFVDIGTDQIVTLRLNGKKYKVKLDSRLANKFNANLAFDVKAEILEITD